ncbi:MAG TPA: AAA family ATPase [Aggregatilineales bacterium]|nr:AAA family ATPase [Aggregatilineales bacterium]
MEHLSLTNFRNYSRLELAMPSGPVLLYGANAQGKTSILEAVFFLATGHSPWTTSDRQLLNWEAEGNVLPFVRISAEIANRRSRLTKIDITLMREESDPRLRKQIRVNGVPKRAVDLLGELNVVMFLPQDLVMIE